MIPPPILAQLATAGFAVRTSAATAARGLKSETYVVRHDGGEAVLKIYNAKGGAPAAKGEREWLALGALAGLPFIPRRLSRAAEAWLLMERLPGLTLRAQWDSLAEDGRRRLCEELGRAYARIALAPQDAAIHHRVRRSRPAPWPDSLPAALEEIERLLRTEPRVASPVFAAAARRIRTLVDVAGGDPILIKADCNTDNALTDGAIVTGLVDWEQACVGDRWTHLGIVLDHTHFLDWPALRSGLEEIGGRWSRDDEDLVLAAGLLCVWRKIIEFDARSSWFSDPARQAARMRAMAAAMGRPEALGD